MFREDPDLDKKIFQIVHAHGTVTSAAILACVKELNSVFEFFTEVLLHESFRRINASLRVFAIEIRSVVMFDADKNERVIYHGVVNTEDDSLSKQLGSDYTVAELNFFSSICMKLVDEKFLSTTELVALDNFNPVQAGLFLAKLQASCWLQRDESNNWKLGSRTYLELRSFIENVIVSGVDDSVVNEAERRLLAQPEIGLLPQLLMY